MAGEVFVTMRPYPDELTYRLVAAASEELAMSPDEVLFAFGEHWIQYASGQGYGELVALAGDDVESVIRHLNDLHRRVSLSFPDIRMPFFHVTDSRPGYFRLHYRSEREGLSSFVAGLVSGLGTMFDTAIRCELILGRQHGHDHDEFDVHHEPNSA